VQCWAVEWRMGAGGDERRRWPMMFPWRGALSRKEAIW
jgi:hypothetical protein